MWIMRILWKKIDKQKSCYHYCTKPVNFFTLTLPSPLIGQNPQELKLFFVKFLYLQICMQHFSALVGHVSPPLSVSPYVRLYVPLYLPPYVHLKKVFFCILDSILIGQEIQSLPYAGFFSCAQISCSL